MNGENNLVGENIRFEYITTNGIKLYTAFAGSPKGRPLILLHGFPDNWYGWKAQIVFFARQGFRVIAPNQRGYSLSDKPKGVVNYTIDHLVADIIGLADALHIDKFYLGGHDFGGFVSWGLANTHPDRILKMVIANVPHPLVMNRYIKNNKAQRKKSWYIYFFNIPGIPELLVKARNWRFLTRSMSHSLSEEEINLYRTAWSQPKAITSMINWYRALKKKNSFKWEIPPKVTVPTLIIWGKRDAFLSHQMGTLSLELCTEGQLKFFEDTSHWVLQRKPDEVNALMLEFLT